MEVQNEDEDKVINEEPTSLSSPVSSSSLKESPRPRRIRSIQELYDVTNQVNLICLYANEEVIFFKM